VCVKVQFLLILQPATMHTPSSVAMHVVGKLAFVRVIPHAWPYPCGSYNRLVLAHLNHILTQMYAMLHAACVGHSEQWLTVG